MKSANIEKINRHLLQQTGVDFSRYQNEELAETIANAISFPLFFARSISRPVSVLIVLDLLAILLSNSGYFKSFLVFPGLVLAIINGVLLGLVLFVYRIRNDMTRVFSISSDLCVQVLRDISVAKAKLANRPDGLPGMSEIFHGVNTVVILPMLIRVLERKVPFLGGLAARVTERFFRVVDKRLTASFQASGRVAPTSQSPASMEQIASWLQTTERMANAVKENIAKVVLAVSRVVAFPFITLFSVSFVISASILYMAYVLIG
jgi:hypothetical protein